jgi:hypothetical protein
MRIRSPTDSFFQCWFYDLLERANLVDSLVAMHPEVKERFTCFDQSRNRRFLNNFHIFLRSSSHCRHYNRFSNDGARIDFLLVEKNLFNQFVVAGTPLLNKQFYTFLNDSRYYETVARSNFFSRMQI